MIATRWAVSAAKADNNAMVDRRGIFQFPTGSPAHIRDEGETAGGLTGAFIHSTPVAARQLMMTLFSLGLVCLTRNFDQIIRETAVRHR